jgi:hypothetical protein
VCDACRKTRSTVQYAVPEFMAGPRKRIDYVDRINGTTLRTVWRVLEIVKK